MKKIVGFAALALMPFALAGCSHPRPVYAYPPPPAYSEVAHRGWNDGVRAAQDDMRHGLPPDAARHERFNNPPVAPPLQEDYRHGFRDGYRAVYNHGGGGGY